MSPCCHGWWVARGRQRVLNALRACAEGRRGAVCVAGAAQREQETECASITKVLSGMSLPDSSLRLCLAAEQQV